MKRLLPGATIGVLGGGQLGRMLLYEAHRMGYEVHILDPDPDCPSAKRADHYIEAPFADAAAAVRLAEGCDVVTLETEHIPADVLDEVARVAPLHPGADVLRNIQDRLAQRRFLAEHDLPQPRFAAVDGPDSLREALAEVGHPAVLKSRRGGYDGKGQARIRSPEEAQQAWAEVGVPAVLEAFVPFDKEVSVLLARGVDGTIAIWPLAENVHRDGVLHTTRAPAAVPIELAKEAEHIAIRTIEALGHVGVAAVEMFVADDTLLINEVAPRTHNSGHYTLGAATTSQFEQHLRAVCGLALGDPTLTRPAAMVNLLGDLWTGGPDWEGVLRHPDARLHLYGKRHARPGRKMGHILVMADDSGRALERAEAMHDILATAGTQTTGPEAKTAR
ncbi:MAG: 5-(carboxyamino)imidazole ribonucleotide synthase [Euryarchaeota archaeon]|nr:5-(carboxyamino)imidazole ribonucleotide synthase [Euryarchaeota archaeon]